MHTRLHLALVVAVLSLCPLSAVWAAPCAPKYDADSTKRVVCLSQECDQFGTTTMDGDGENIVACLKDGGDLKWKAMTSAAPDIDIRVKTKTHPFVGTSNYLDCDAGYTAIACTSLTIPSGQYTCQTTPDKTNPSTGRSSCVQAGCTSQAAGDTGYYSTTTCMKGK